MKLSALYTNNDSTFPPIEFHEGLNVIFARVKDPRAKDQDSHNLGKTFLIEVIDFALLKSIDRDHPFKKFTSSFGPFVFFIEVKTSTGRWVTIRRAVTGRNPCALLVSDTRMGVLADSDTAQWTFSGLSLKKAREKLDQLLGLDVIHPYTFRKGFGYVMRRQSDWDEVFHLERFRRGRDRDWKPLVAKLLGFDTTAVIEKYNLDDEISSLEIVLHGIELEAGSTRTEYDKLKGLIELRHTAVAQKREELNQFSFRELEAEVSERGAKVIEGEISRLNERRYSIDLELVEIERSLATSLPFDLVRIRQIFEEAQIAFSSSISRSYEELIEFNRRISSGRAERLNALRKKLLRDRNLVEERLGILDVERQSALSTLQERETLQKYLWLQEEIRAQDREIIELERRLDKLDGATSTQKQIQDTRARLLSAVESIRDAVQKGNSRLTSVRRLFAEYVRRVLSIPALLSVSVNESGNLTFDVQTLDRNAGERETSEAEGTSYKKLLCACFDMALVTEFWKNGFYHFLFHDGVLEGLDNRKKVALLALVRDVCSSYNLQYVLTVIDSDIPRNERDQKLLFTPGEVVRELHDQGDDGRLFRMPAF